MCFSHYLAVWGRRGGGGGWLPRGLGHNLLRQFCSLGSSKMELSKTDFFDILTIQNDKISDIKHVLAPLYVFFHPIWVCVCVELGHNLLMQFSSLDSSRMVVPLPSSRCLAEGNRISPAVLCIQVHNTHGWLKDALDVPHAYGNLCVSTAANGRASNPCTNVPVQCPVVTCLRYICAYVIESHMWEQTPSSEEVVFVLSAAERAAVIAQCESKPKMVDATNAQFKAPQPLPPPLVFVVALGSPCGSGITTGRPCLSIPPGAFPTPSCSHQRQGTQRGPTQ